MTRLASDARTIARAAVRAVTPAAAIPRHLRRRGDRILLDGVPWADAEGGPVRIVALGKAAGPMVDAARRALGPLAGPAWAAMPRGYPSPRARAWALRGEHPLPGPGSVAAGRALRDAVGGAPPAGALLFLISGGGSATAELPAEGLSLPDLRATTRALLAGGAPIATVNVVRRHLSALKGGGLARAAGARPFRTLAISDVVGDAPWDIAGGPTVPDPTTFADALAALRRYRLLRTVPPSVLRHLRDGARRRPSEGRTPDDLAEGLGSFRIVGSNAIARTAAGAAAARLGYRVDLAPSPVTGEALRVGRRLARELKIRAGRTRSPVAWISGGETTVHLGTRPGRGGRNEELALASVPVLDGVPGVLLLSVASDGVDGSSSAAGGLVDGGTAARARRAGVRVGLALRRHAADDALARIGARYVTGPTGTNVADLQVRLAVPRTGRTRPRGAVPTSRRRRSSSAGSR